jgi:hypothetical protein
MVFLLFIKLTVTSRESVGKVNSLGVNLLKVAKRNVQRQKVVTPTDEEYLSSLSQMTPYSISYVHAGSVYTLVVFCTHVFVPPTVLVGEVPVVFV